VAADCSQLFAFAEHVRTLNAHAASESLFSLDGFAVRLELRAASIQPAILRERVHVFTTWLSWWKSHRRQREIDAQVIARAAIPGDFKIFMPLPLKK
jgi:hypothetical protein